MIKELEKINARKKNENGDVAYTTTGNNLVDILFMTPYFEKHLDQVRIGNSDKEKLFSMFMRDPRFGQGRRDLGRELLKQSGVNAQDVALCGRFDDLWHIPTEENISYLKQELLKGNELAKKWLPRLTGKDKLSAKVLCKLWGLNEKKYRKLIKVENTTEYKLSYAEKNNQESPLNELFNKYEYLHPLVDTIDFEKVPSLAMNKYLHAFSTREDIKDRFNEYINKVKENKAKINVSTSNVMDAYKTAKGGDWTTQEVEKEAREVVANKIIENETLDVSLDAIVILDTSGSMTMGYGLGYKPIEKAYALAYAISTCSSYSPNQLISFSSKPRLITIKGDTLQEKYKSMYTGDWTNTDFGKVMKLLSELKKYPEYIIVLSDMEFDEGSSTSKKRTMEIFKEHGANTKIVWWNLNSRNKTVPEFDNYGNIYLSGYNIQILKLLKNKFNMEEYIDNILKNYLNDLRNLNKKKVDNQ